MAGVFDIDIRPFKAGKLAEIRKSLPVRFDELSLRGDSSALPYPSIAEMAFRAGVWPTTWGEWENRGIRKGAWPALLRLMFEEDASTAPVRATIAEIIALAEISGSWSALARDIGATRDAIYKWRGRTGYVPSGPGFGRLVRLLHRDIYGVASQAQGLDLVERLRVGVGVSVSTGKHTTTAVLRSCSASNQEVELTITQHSSGMPAVTKKTSMHKDDAPKLLHGACWLSINNVSKVSNNHVTVRVTTAQGTIVKVGKANGLR